MFRWASIFNSMSDVIQTIDLGNLRSKLIAVLMYRFEKFLKELKNSLYNLSFT